MPLRLLVAGDVLACGHDCLVFADAEGQIVLTDHAGLSDAELLDWIDVVVKTQPNYAVLHPLKSDTWGDEVVRLLTVIRAAYVAGQAAASVPREPTHTLMARFVMYRRNLDAQGKHDENQKAPDDAVQFEGVQFNDGSVAIRWRTPIRSTSVWTCMNDMLKVHGHPEYGSEIVWLDAAPAVAPEKE